MADHLHPAIDIPGRMWEGRPVGLWQGAPVRTLGVRPRSGVVVRALPSEAGALVAFDEWDTHRHGLRSLSLRLDDPLGLVGLARQVRARCGIESTDGDSIAQLATQLIGQPWALPHWRLRPSVTVIREAAALTARLDRLAVAVWPEYRVEPGRVPGWEREEKIGWMLKIEQNTMHFPDHPGLDTPGPLAALGAALEACGG